MFNSNNHAKKTDNKLFYNRINLKNFSVFLFNTICLFSVFFSITNRGFLPLFSSIFILLNCGSLSLYLSYSPNGFIFHFFCVLLLFIFHFFILSFTTHKMQYFYYFLLITVLLIFCYNFFLRIIIHKSTFFRKICFGHLNFTIKGVFLLYFSTIFICNFFQFYVPTRAISHKV